MVGDDNVMVKNAGCCCEMLRCCLLMLGGVEEWLGVAGCCWGGSECCWVELGNAEVTLGGAVWCLLMLASDE